MPDHDLHPYFRFLVDHQDLMKSDINSKSVEEENSCRSSLEETGGALSLLGSLYGSAEDEEGVSENALSLKKNDLEEAVDPDKTTVSTRLQELDSSILAAARDEKSVKHHIPSLKDAPKVIRRNHSISTVKAGTIHGLKKEGSSSGCVPSTVDQVQNSSSSKLCKPELPIVEPPSDMKRVVDKIVEFILRNGKEFEAVLVQQDAKHGRFPFLSPSNQYHLYYLKALQKAQEPKLAGKSCNSEKNGVGEESESLSLPSDIPYDSDKKEKFKMVIGKSKREGQPDANTSAASQAQPAGVSMDAATTAAILQAARKGMTYPNLDIFSKNSQNCVSQGRSSGDGGEPGSFNSSRPHSSTQKMVPLAKAIAKTAAIAAADEADSSEVGLTREQKLKAERLKRAKLFAAMIKGGAAAPLKNEPLHRVPSLEPPDSGLSRSGGASDANNVVDDRERDGSLAPMHADSSEKIEKMENTKQHADALMDRRSKRSYRPRSGKDEEGEEEMKEDGEEHKHSRKKRRSNGSSHHHSRDTGKHKRRRSSHPTRANSSDDEDGHSRHKHKESLSSEDEHDQKRRHSDRRRHKHNASSDDERKHPRHHHRDHNDSSGDERKHSRRRHNKHVESDDGRREHKRTSRRDKRVSKSRRDVEMEEGEVHAKSSDQSKASETRNSGSRETSVELSKSGRDSAKAAPLPEPSQKTDDVPDDLRAKVRAMLMATL
ncbi:unnamed protein product [Linum tenue]|uniref:SURP motif domain-containing protein n=1 Tax=Linum tenue TaxID=586396 RepID=A0AAV0LSU7_9ROSI|nr:unnamed protein product [Linum tenue]CAI0437285.1 unnamed protein product [Linum tenue]